MLTLNDDQSFLPAPHQLVRVDDGRVLMTRSLRTVDAEAFNRQWQERGIPTRWEPMHSAAAVA